MDVNSVPFQKTVFVCTNVRSDGRTACANPGRGGDALCHALKDEVKRLGLKGKVRVVRTGCLDRCEQGPNLFLFPEGKWLSGVSEADLPEIVKNLK